MLTKISIGDDTFEVEWEGEGDYLEPEGKRVWYDRIISCPEEMIKKYGESLIIYKCVQAEDWYNNNTAPLPCFF